MRRIKRDSLELTVYGKHGRALEGQAKRRGQWVYVGVDTDDPLWTPDSPSFLNSWGNDVNGGPLRFRHNSIGGVDIQGAVTGGADGTVIFTLPHDYWPESPTSIACGSFDGKAIPIILVNSNGQVSLLASVGLSNGLGTSGGTDFAVDEGTVAVLAARNITLTALHGGSDANFIHFSAYDITNGGVANQRFKIVVEPNQPGVDQHIKVYLHTNSSGYSDTTPYDLINALNADPVVSKLVTTTFNGGTGLLGVYDAIGPP